MRSQTCGCCLRGHGIRVALYLFGGFRSDVAGRGAGAASGDNKAAAMVVHLVCV